MKSAKEGWTVWDLRKSIKLKGRTIQWESRNLDKVENVHGAYAIGHYTFRLKEGEEVPICAPVFRDPGEPWRPVNGLRALYDAADAALALSREAPAIRDARARRNIERVNEKRREAILLRAKEVNQELRRLRKNNPDMSEASMFRIIARSARKRGEKGFSMSTLRRMKRMPPLKTPSRRKKRSQTVV